MVPLWERGLVSKAYREAYPATAATLFKHQGVVGKCPAHSRVKSDIIQASFLSCGAFWICHYGGEGCGKLDATTGTRPASIAVQGVVRDW